ncbi:hypothetical protein F5148DRAFT_932253 [Russula earlei]|uniref:Uncharacterized protein n=1 Tax=Russula earlei TaxID=71964 RepID=A0ACC0UAQ8_9AGAM|nr:hypothetical protein F5148DRAFT_932253 [Russula earlei]
MIFLPALLGRVRSSAVIASDPEAHGDQTPLAERGMPSRPASVQNRARGTVAALPFHTTPTPTRTEVEDYFSMPSPTLHRGTVLSRHDLSPMPSITPSSNDIPPPYEYPPPQLPVSFGGDSAESPSATDQIWASHNISAAVTAVVFTSLVLVIIQFYYA